MRSRRSTPSRNSSTAGSRRSSARPLAAALGTVLGLGLPVLGVAALAALPAPAAGAQVIELSVAPGDQSFTAAMSFHWSSTDALIESLRRGLESRITFTARLYERRRPAFAFAGDRLVLERTVVRSAFWDFLGQAFVLEEEGRPPETCTDPAQLVRSFFSVEESFPSARADASRGRRYVAARARFEPVRLMPPLTLVGLAGAAASVTTPWVHREAP